MTLSSAEAEYVAATSATCQAMWMRKVHILTKPLAKNFFEHLRESIGITNIHGSED